MARQSGAEGTNLIRHAFAFRDERLECGRVDIANVEGNLEIGASFSARRFCDREKLVQLARPLALKTLSDVGRDANCGAANLIP